MFQTLLTRFSLWAASPAATGTGDAAANDGGVVSMLTSLLPIVAIVVVFYFFIIRPESKRKKEAAQMRNELMAGDEITTIGGISGRVISVEDDSIVLETGTDHTKLKIMRWAISAKGKQSEQNQK